MVMTHNVDMIMNIIVVLLSATLGFTGVYKAYRNSGKLELPTLYFLIVSCVMVLAGLTMPLFQ